MFQRTTATKKLQQLTKRIRGVQGGTSASKTISILLILIHLAQTDEEPTLTSVVSETMPHLRKGALRDFKNIMKAHNYWKESRWNATNSIYTFETGSEMEFFGADQSARVRGPRRQRLFCNEANNISFAAFEELEVRTSKEVWLDWNPTNEFWFYTDVLTSRNDVEHITLTYKDNEALEQSIVDSIEQRKNRKGWWRVYGEGKLGEVEGKIYKGWDIIEKIPDTAKLLRVGIDFGYSNDPTAIVEIWKLNEVLIINEVTFKKGLSNKQIADILLANEYSVLIVADSAEPKSIDEIASYGVTIVGSKKGKDSVNHGIQYIQDCKIAVTKRSVNVIKEYRNYLWMTDRDGNILNKPEHTFSHSMDAVRYGIAGVIDTKPVKKNEYAQAVKSYGRSGILDDEEGKVASILDPHQQKDPMQDYSDQLESFANA